MPVFRVASSSPYAPVIGFSSAVRAGNLVFVAGTTAVDSSGAVIGGDDPYARRKRPCARSARCSPRQAPTCRMLSRRGCTLFAQSIGSTSGAPTGRSSPRILRPRPWSSSQCCSTHACLLRSKPSPISACDRRRPPRCACGSADPLEAHHDLCIEAYSWTPKSGPAVVSWSWTFADLEIPA